MKIIGMDLSLTSPALVVLDRSQRDSPRVTEIFFATEVASLAKKMGGWRFTPSEKGLSKKTEQYRLERLLFLYSQIVVAIKAIGPDCIALEDYGFVGKGAGFYPAELIGLVKIWIFVHGIPLRLYDPQAIKMFAAGKGNADKEQMCEVCEQRWRINLQIYGRARPDVADAAAIAFLLHDELLARENPNAILLLTDNTRRVLNRVTKNNPVNILFQSFVKKEANS